MLRFLQDLYFDHHDVFLDLGRLLEKRSWVAQRSILPAPSDVSLSCSLIQAHPMMMTLVVVVVVVVEALSRQQKCTCTAVVPFAALSTANTHTH